MGCSASLSHHFETKKRDASSIQFIALPLPLGKGKEAFSNDL